MPSLAAAREKTVVCSTESLRRAIDGRRGQAEMLLSIATDHAAREHVQLAGRDLDKALTWLDRRTSIGPVELLVDLAAWRLNTIREALGDEGADTALL